MESLWEVTNALSNGTIPVLLRPPLPQDWVLQPHAKTAIAIISGTAKATDCKFADTFTGSIRKKAPLKIWEKTERGRIHGLPKFFSVPPVISRTGKATNFQFCVHILSIDRKKVRYKFQEK